MGRAIVVHDVGGPDVLRLEAHDPGAPGPGEARVRLRAAGVNFIDIYFRTGLYPRDLPTVLGLEGAGQVEAIGDGVATVRPGDRVCWAMAPGAYADAALVPANRLVGIPAGVSDELAAACMLQGMTAHYLSRATWPTKPGDVALVHAAAGGVGLLLVQLLKAAGAEVIGTCSTEAKADRARAAGADHVVLYTRDDFVTRLRELTGGRSADVVFDSVGASTFEGSLAVLRPRGLLVLFGQSSGPVPPFEIRRLNDLGSLFLTRPSLAHYIGNRDELQLRAGAILGGIADGSLTVTIGARFPLANAADAHRALEGRETTGKVVLLTE